MVDNNSCCKNLFLRYVFCKSSFYTCWRYIDILYPITINIKLFGDVIYDWVNAPDEWLLVCNVNCKLATSVLLSSMQFETHFLLMPSFDVSCQCWLLCIRSNKQMWHWGDKICGNMVASTTNHKSLSDCSASLFHRILFKFTLKTFFSADIIII